MKADRMYSIRIHFKHKKIYKKNPSRGNIFFELYYANSFDSFRNLTRGIEMKFLQFFLVISFLRENDIKSQLSSEVRKKSKKKKKTTKQHKSDIGN